ncbi:MAG: methyltransferase domain-containing protein [Myxococcales bacterium]
MAAPSRYLHGTSPTEQERLSLLNRLMNEAALRELSLGGGERIVDFGSGLGQLSLGMARVAGQRLVGIEHSEEQLARAERDPLLDLRQGDVTDPPLREDEWGRFDVAHARFILEHVPDPPAVVRQMVRAVRPGGRIVLQDDDHDVLRFHPEPPGFMTMWRAYERTYDRIGCDPYIGRRLVSLLHEAGAKPSRSTLLNFGSCAGDPNFPSFIENISVILEGARGAIVGGGLLGRAEFEAGLDGLAAWSQRPDAAFWYAIFWAEGVRP